MRVAIIHPRMSVKGGGERVAIHSIIELIREGHEISLIGEEFDIEGFEDFFGCEGLFDKVQLLTYRPFRPFTRKAVLYQRLIYNQRRLRAVLSQSPRFDLILNTAEVANQPATKSPSIQYCYFPEFFSHLESGKGYSLWDLYYEPARIFYHSRVSRIDQLLAVSEFTRGVVRQMWGRDSITLYPPCPIDLYQGLNLSKEDLVVTVGRISPEKRMNLFVEIARRLPRIKFAIIGSKVSGNESYYQSLSSEAPGNLSITVLPLRKAKDLLGRAKIYVHCAKDEHFGITIVEAMAAGCVGIVHNSGGPREIVTPDVGYRWDSLKEAVVQITDVLNNESLRRRLSQSAASSAERFGPEKFESSLGEIVNKYSPR